jgi:hypothetical protein
MDTLPTNGKLPRKSERNGPCRTYTDLVSREISVSGPGVGGVSLMVALDGSWTDCHPPAFVVCALSPPATRVVGSRHRRHSFSTGPSVPLERAKALVPPLGHQQRKADPLLGQVRQCGMPQMVKRPPLLAILSRPCLNRYSRPLVGQPASPGDRREIYGCWRTGRARASVGEEDRAGPATADRGEAEHGPTARPQRSRAASTRRGDVVGVERGPLQVGWCQLP